MPEGPSIVILKDAVQQFTGKTVEEVSGNSKKIAFDRIKGQKILAIKSFGKQLLICFKAFTVRIHLLMFGSYRINEAKEVSPRLHLQFKKGELNFYACSVKMIEEDLDTVYDWSADVMSPLWNPVKAFEKLRSKKKLMVCDSKHLCRGWEHY
jgi:endonuclease-8